MTAWNLELVAIARDWVSSFVMLCQAFSSCLYAALSAFSLSSASEMQLNQIDSANAEYYTFLFFLQKLLGCFCCMFWVFFQLYYEALPNQLCCIWLNLGGQYISIHSIIVSSSLNTVTQSHWKPCSSCITLLHTAQQMMLCALIMSCSILLASRHSGIGWS